MDKLNRKGQWLLGFVLFFLVSFFLYQPLLEGKKLMGSDQLQFRAMEHERITYSEKEGKDIYWTNSVFGGMPTYLLGADYPLNIPGKVMKIVSAIPKPVNYLFLYFIGFLLLMYALRVEPLKAIAGALAFTLSTYLIIILQVGHFSKAGAIAFFPWIIAGILLIVERKKYPLGFFVLLSGMALEVHAKHYQMTYYLLFAVLVLGAIYLWEAYKNKRLTEFGKELLLMIGAVVIGIGLNWTSILAVKEYISQSIRGERYLNITPDGKPVSKKEGLDKAYITEYSYGIAETFNLFIPGFTGGSNREQLNENSALYEAVESKAGRATAKRFVENVSLYWGDQPIVMAPAYIGAVVLFLALLGFLLYSGRFKKWILITSVLVLLLSWGKNLPWLTDFFIDYVPMYNKFRVVASIQVILEFLMPLMAVLGLVAFFDEKVDEKQKEKALKISVGILGGIALFFALLGPSLFNFTSAQDVLYEPYGLVDALIEDRKSLMRSDAFRSLIFVLLSAGILGLTLKNKLRKMPALLSLILLIIFDLGGVAKRYIREDDFMTDRQIKSFFQPTQVDKEILKDKSYYRVINFARNPLTDGLTSYFHKNLGGYHAAKPRRIQDIFDFHLTDSIHPEVLSMYNVKYMIFNTEKGLQYTNNPGALGNAWFVEKVKKVQSQDEEILALNKTDLSRVAILSEKMNEVGDHFAPDSSAFIKLTSYHPQKLEYISENSKEGFAVFSENYYPYGWKAFVDGKPVEIFRVNYSLRGLKIPAGKHKIVMQFEPEVIKTGTKITLFFIVLFVLSIIWLGYSIWKKKS